MHIASMLYFVFIINKSSIPNPFLVEVDRRSTPRLKDMKYLEPNVLFCPKAMSSLLLQIKNMTSNIKDHH